MGDFEMFTKKF